VVEATLRDAAGRPAIRCAFRIIYRSTYVRLAVSSSPTCMPTCTSTRQPTCRSWRPAATSVGSSAQNAAVLRSCGSVHPSMPALVRRRGRLARAWPGPPPASWAWSPGLYLDL